MASGETNEGNNRETVDINVEIILAPSYIMHSYYLVKILLVLLTDAELALISLPVLIIWENCLFFKLFQLH